MAWLARDSTHTHLAKQGPRWVEHLRFQGGGGRQSQSNPITLLIYGIRIARQEQQPPRCTPLAQKVQPIKLALAQQSGELYTLFV
jgi:hypothetical protein